jgi:MYXO-CTERM domain-containing protein
VRVDGGAVDLVATVDSGDGTQLPPGGEPDGGAPIKTGKIQGGGCSCTLATQAQPSGGWLIAMALVLGAGLRRRRRSR